MFPTEFMCPLEHIRLTMKVITASQSNVASTSIVKVAKLLSSAHERIAS